MRTAILLFMLPLSFTSVAIGASLDWPQFRGPTGQGLSEAKGLPTEWGPTKNIAWRADIPGAGWASPALAGDRIYLTSAVDAGGGRLSLRALCLDAGSGKIVWNVEVLRPDPALARKKHGKNSPASPTPIVADGKVYVHFGPMGTAALNADDGKVLWKQTDLQFPPVHGNGGSPALWNDTLFFSCDGAKDPYFAALDAKTGAVRWKTARNTPGGAAPFSFSTPLVIDVDGKPQVISPASGFVGAYDPADGHEICRVRYGTGYSVVPRPAFANGILVVSSGFDVPVLYGIDPRGAAGDVTDTHVKWKTKKGAPNTPSPLIVGEEVYTISDGGTAACTDLKTGNTLWTHRLAGGYSASPVYGDGKIYFQNETGVGFVVAAGKEFKQLAENDLGERSLASYAVTDGALFIRTEKHLWKIGAK